MRLMEYAAWCASSAENSGLFSCYYHPDTPDPMTAMSRKGGMDSLSELGHVRQNGARVQSSAKEAAMKLFSKSMGKDNPSKMPSLLLESTDQETRFDPFRGHGEQTET